MEAMWRRLRRIPVGWIDAATTEARSARARWGGAWRRVPAGGPSWSIASIASVAPSTSVATNRRAPAPPPPTTTTATAGSAGSRVACIRRPPPPLVDPSRGAPAARLDARRGFAASPTSSSDGTHNPVSSILPRKHFTDAMRAARDAGDVPAVMKHFAELCERYPDSQGPGAFEILLSVAAAEGNPEAAVDTLEAMLSLGYPPTHHTHRKIIVAHNRGGQLDRAWEWLQMLAESEGNEYLAHAEGNAGARLFDAILVGAGKVADANVFNECWRVMRSMGVDPTEGTLEAHMLMESKVGWSEGVETAWERRDAGFEYLHPISKRSPRLFCRRVEAHARIATYLLKPRDVRRGGRAVGVGGDGGGRAGGRHSRETRRAAWISRAAAAIALDELYARTTPEPATDTAVNGDASGTHAVTHPRDVRDATTTLCNAYAACGDSDAIRDLMERAQLAGVAPDSHMFNALLRSEAADRSLAWDPAEDAGGNAGGGFSVGGSIPAGDVAGPGAGIGYTHAEELQDAVIRVEEMMRDMLESGVRPDLHSFMALLAAYAKVGDVAAAGDALAGMKARGIELDTWAFNALLQACAAASDLDAASKVRASMKKSSVAADDITFLHLFTACARRTRQVAVALRDEEDWDEEWEWGGDGEGGAWVDEDEDGARRHHLGARAAESHAKLAGALLVDPGVGGSIPGGDLRGTLGRTIGVREAAAAAAAAAREGLSSVRGVFEDLRSDGEPIRLTPASVDAHRFPPSSSSLSRRQHVHAASPELARARAALREFRADMDASGVAFTPQCATALVQTMGRLREFDEMMAFVRSPPPGVPPDVYMYTQALHALAQDPFHWRRAHSTGDEGNDGSDDVRDASRRVETGPEAALQLADEMTSLGVAHTRVTLNCVLLACAHLRDYDEAIRRFETHVNGGGEVGVDTYNALLRCAWAAGVFSQNASSIAQALENEGLKPNAHTELTLRRCGGFGQGMGGDRDASDALLRRFGFAVEAPAPPPREPMPWEKDDEDEKMPTSSSAYKGPPPRKPLVAEIGVDVEDDDDVDKLAEGDMEEPLVYSRKDGKLTRAGRRWEKGRK